MSFKEFVKTSFEKLNVTDNNEYYDVYHYKFCDEKSPKYMKMCRSVVVDKSNEIVSIAFPFTYEMTQNEFQQSLMYQSNEQLLSIQSYEGSVVRLFYDYHNSRWNVGTMRKLDAFSSRWGSRESFGELFENGLSKIVPDGEISNWYDSLDKQFTYTFLIPTSSNSRFVCTNKDISPVIYTGRFNNDDLSYDHTNFPQFFTNVGYTEMTCDEIISIVSQTDITQYQGVFCYNPVTFEFYKIYNDNYLNAKILRGNEPDLRKRYFQTIKDSELHRRFREHFSEHSRLFRRLDGSFHSLVKDVLHSNTKQCDEQLVKFLSSSPKFTNYRKLSEYLKTLDTSILWSSVIYRMKNQNQQLSST